MIAEPALLLADEPTGNLDTRTTEAVMDLFDSLNAEGMSIIMVTHSEACAQYAHRLMQVSDGKIVVDQPLSGRYLAN